MKFNRFEDMEIWKNSRELVKRIYELTNNNNFAKDFSFIDQIRRSSVSIPCNIAEGYERKSNTEFIRFLYISKGSAGELRTQLYLANDLGYVDDTEFSALMEMAVCISKGLSGFIKYLSSRI